MKRDWRERAHARPFFSVYMGVCFVGEHIPQTCMCLYSVYTFFINHKRSPKFILFHIFNMELKWVFIDTIYLYVCNAWRCIVQSIYDFILCQLHFISLCVCDVSTGKYFNSLPTMFVQMFAWIDKLKWKKKWFEMYKSDKPEWMRLNYSPSTVQREMIRVNIWMNHTLSHSLFPLNVCLFHSSDACNNTDDYPNFVSFYFISFLQTQKNLSTLRIVSIRKTSRLSQHFRYNRTCHGATIF